MARRIARPSTLAFMLPGRQYPASREACPGLRPHGGPVELP